MVSSSTRTLISTLASLLLLLAVAVPGQAQDSQDMYDTSIMDALEAEGEYSTLITALDAAGFAQPLSVEGPYTLFAPTDEAFDAMPEGELDAIMEDPEILMGLMGYHLVPGEHGAADLAGTETLDTAFGETLTVTADGDMVRVNNASVIQAGIEADNGLIHSVDEVIMDR